jgi:hypothetical protein
MFVIEITNLRKNFGILAGFSISMILLATYFFRKTEV